MYAYDTSISLAAANVSDLENKINRELINLNRWLKANKLSLNIAKTEFMIIGYRQRIQTNCCNHQFNIQLKSKNIENVDHTKSLGIFIDKNLSWKKHITETSKKIAYAIGALKRTRKFICQKTAQKIYAGLIEPQFDYCSTVWDGIRKTLSDKLQKYTKSRRKSYYKINLRNQRNCSPGQAWLGAITNKTKKARGSDSLQSNS